MVRVEVFTFCESATQNGRTMSIDNIFDSLEVDTFPAGSNDFAIAIRLRLPRNNPFSICRLLFLGPDGELVLKPADFRVTGPVWNAVVTNRKVKFAKEGIYHAVLYADEQMVTSLPLFVKKVPKPGEILEGSLN